MSPELAPSENPAGCISSRARPRYSWGGGWGLGQSLSSVPEVSWNPRPSRGRSGRTHPKGPFSSVTEPRFPGQDGCWQPSMRGSGSPRGQHSPRMWSLVFIIGPPLYQYVTRSSHRGNVFSASDPRNRGEGFRSSGQNASFGQRSG